jgi:hypothetical protein
MARPQIAGEDCTMPSMVHGVRQRVVRSFRQPRRRQIIAVVLGTVAVAGLLLWRARGVEHYEQNLALNVGADIVGALVTIFLISPILRRAQGGRVREHIRLDYDWFSEQVSAAALSVKVLDTFSNLLDSPVNARFFAAVRSAVDRRAYVHILLLDPESLAVAQRASELGEMPGGADVRREILRNLRALHEFSKRLTDAQRRRFEVRLYSASAGITLYRWDDKVLVSFLTLGRLSGQGPQLEVAVASPLGGFVEQRFDELWRYSTPMMHFMSMPVTLVEPDGALREFACRYVLHDDEIYLIDHVLVAELARRRAEPVEAYCRAETAVRYELGVAEDGVLLATLRELYAEKYDGTASAFIHLKAVA